jgi:DNA invertase Pin-like site-specific DNA recombinase
MTLRAVLYARVSKDAGDQDPESQLQALRALSQVRGFRIIAEHDDRITGDIERRKGDPPGLARALERLQQRKADVLVIFAADRLVRSPVGLLQLLGRIQATGARIVSAQDGADLDTTTDTGELLVFLRGWFARMELRLNRARTSAGLDRARAAGKKLGRPRAPEPCEACVWDRRLLGTVRIAELLGSTRHRVRRVLARLKTRRAELGRPFLDGEIASTPDCHHCQALANNGGSESGPRPEEKGRPIHVW